MRSVLDSFSEAIGALLARHPVMSNAIGAVILVLGLTLVGALAATTLAVEDALTRHVPIARVS